MTSPVAVATPQAQNSAIDDEEDSPHDQDSRDRRDKAGLGAWLSTWNPELRLENSGSVARDHLANERTWLAYLRTSLAITSTGVALVQLFTISPSETIDHRLHNFARPLGATTVGLGILILFIGALRYFKIQSALVLGRFPPARKSMWIISSVLVCIVAVVFGVIIGVRS